MNSNTLIKNENLGTIVDLFSELITECIKEGIKMGEVEKGMRVALQKIGQEALGKALEKSEEKVINCRCDCGHKANYEGMRSGTVLTVFGKIKYKRQYYRCISCSKGWKPLDEAMNIEPGEMSDGLFPLVALLGIQTSFEEATKLTEELLLLKISDNSIRKATQKMGNQREQIEKRWQDDSNWHHYTDNPKRQAEGVPRRYYGSIDGVMTPGRKKKEYRELKAIAWYEVTPLSDRQWSSRFKDRIGELEGLKAKNIHYYCDVKPAEEFGSLLWATGCHHKADLAKELIFVCDGAHWIWNQIDHYFPDAVQILDWFHAVSYLTPIAQLLYAEEEARKIWLECMKKQLWAGQTQAVIDLCLDLANNKPMAEFAQTAATYYQNNIERMRYPFFRQEGYFLGSGVIESGCKQIGSMRLKRPGAQWLKEGAASVAKARAAWLSGQWQETTDSFHSLLYA